MSVARSGTFRLAGRLEVTRLGFGAMRITGPGIWGPPADPDEAIRVLRRAVELGVDFIDTADAYGPEVSEDLIFRALHGADGYDGVVVATKGGLTRQGPERWAPVGRPEYLRQCLQMSLRRLGLEQVPLWQLHRIDRRVPREEQFGVLKEFVDEGLVGLVGLSQVGVDEIRAAREAGLEIASVQNRYNLSDRSAEDVLEYCEAEGIGFIPWAPMAAGRLAQAGGVLDQVLQAHPGASPSQVALAWLLRRSPVVLPIPGTGSVAHLEANCAAADLELSEQEVTALEAA
ncbi:Predicted oxidoreductase [Raineyella antarctica]|uniref:Predicted oxidoreductase n=1 Tax=Raineyella antarctica TaxID=1577474 RepID=A0A1G6GCR5_9ACTN|nr:aldo/keto reductase [Raineyella antarctica]SDB79778.1 Predicted oxidoreductase [Raineyella antarctica]